MDKEDGKEKGYILEEDLSNLRLEGYASKQEVKQQQICGTLYGSSLATEAAGFNIVSTGCGTGSGTSERDYRNQLITSETSAKSKHRIQTNDRDEQIYSRISDLDAPEKPKLFLPPGKKYHAFFSYASPDIQWVKEIVETLESEHGFICCEYDRDNTPGRLLLPFAEDSIKNACKTVVVMTKEAFKSDFVKHEIQMALLQGFDTERKCVVPVLVQDCTVPDYLRIVNYVDARDPTQRDIWFPKLLTELQTQDVAEGNQINPQLIERTATELDDGNIIEEQQQLYKTTENGTWV